MKRSLIAIVLVLVLVCSMLVLVACGNNNSTPQEDNTPTKLQARKLASVSDLWQNLTGLGYPQASLFVKKSLVEEEPQTVRAFAAAVQSSIEYLNQSSENALALGNYMQSRGDSALKGAVVSKCYLDMRQQYKTAAQAQQDVTQLVNVLMPQLANVDYSGIFYTDNGATGTEGTGQLTVMAPDGAPAMALAYMMQNTTTLVGHSLQYSIIGGQQVAASMTNGDADFIIAPTNAGVAKSFQTDKYRLVAVTSWGNLFILSTDPDLKSLSQCNNDATAFLAQFAGKSISSIGQSQVPDLTLKHLLGLANVQVDVVDGTDAGTIQTDLLQRRITNALLGEPAVTGTIALVAANQ